LPQAQQYIEDLKAIDADAVKRAMTFFPLSTPTSSAETSAKGDETTTPTTESKPTPTASGQLRPATDTLFVAATAEAANSVNEPVEDASTEANKVGVIATDDVPDIPTLPTTTDEAVARMAAAPTTLSQAELLSSRGTNRWVLLSVMVGSGGVLFVAMRSILGCCCNDASSTP
jgi:hypothetical protein